MADHVDSLIGEIQNAHIEPTIAPEETDNEAGNYEDSAPQIETTDARGTQFDPAKHETDESGAPLYTPKGRFKKKPRATIRNAGHSGNASKSAGPKINIPGQESVIGNQVDLSDTMACAAVASATYIQIGVALFGPEWFPNRQMQEQEGLTQAFNIYFEEKGIDDFPPGLALAVALGGYAAQRLHKPETQSRLALYWGWARLKIGSLIWRKQYASRNDSRANRVRENDAGEADSEASPRGWRRMFGA